MIYGGKRYTAGQHRRADRLRAAAGQEAQAAQGVGADGALRHLSVRAGIIVTGTEVLSGLIRDANGPWLSEALRGTRRVARADRRGRRPSGRPATRAGLLLGRRPGADERRARADRGRPDGRGGRGVGGDDDGARSGAGGADLGDREPAAASGSGAKRRRCGRARASRPTCRWVPWCWSLRAPRPAFLVGRRRWSPSCRGRRASCRRMWADAVAIEPLAGLLRLGRDVGAADPALLPVARAADRGDAARARRRRAAVRGHDLPASRRARGRDGLRPADAGAAYAGFEAQVRERHGDVLFSDDDATIDEVIARACCPG